MSADVNLDLTDYLYGLVAADAALIAIMDPGAPEVRLRHRMALPNDKFPYLTHRLVLSPVEPWGLYTGQWIVEIWDHSANAARAYDIRKRLKEILQRRFYGEAAGKAILGSRIWVQVDEDLSDDTERVTRLHLRFGLRVIAKGEIEAVTDREGV